MKAAYILLAILLMTASLCAFPVRISSWNIDNDVKMLSSMNISIDSVNRQTGAIMAFVRNETEYQQILANGFDALRLENPAPELARRLNDPYRERIPGRYDYYTLTEYHNLLQQMETNHPQLCNVVNAGTTVQGRPIYFLKISQNVAQELDKPEFRYISSIHGDEVVGYDMLIRLIQRLVGDYGTDPRITEIVNNTEIWICPMMNPDGFMLGQRYNAAGIDLNRNFPMPSGNQHPDGEAWAPEVMAIMDFSLARGFQLSANFHGGAQVVNYPWDYTFMLTPDNDLIHEAALTYSRENSLLYNSTEFPQGVVNGAQWYVITGSLQDWSYGYTDCIDLTCEIGNNKWPPASQLQNFWNQNQESMLSLLEFAQSGVHGKVKSIDGVPLTDATITVASNAKIMHVNPENADYHRLLLPGTYTVTANAPGYIAEMVQISVSVSGSATHNFELRPASITSLNGQLRTADGNPLPTISVSLNSDPVQTASTDANGCFAFNSIFEGYYKLSFSQAGELLYEKNILLLEENKRMVFVHTPPVTVFYDSFDTIANWTPTLPWGIVTHESDSVLTDSPSGNYANNINKSCLLTNPLDLSNISNPRLSYRVKYVLESGYDFVYLEGSVDGQNWQVLTSYTGTQNTWTNEVIPLEQYAGQQLRLRYRIQTDWGTTKDGIYIDDLLVQGISLDSQFLGDANQDAIISALDVQAVLDYCVGLNPGPGLAPETCDVDQNGSLDVRDALLIHKYISEPEFRFPAQGAEPSTYPVVNLSYENLEGIHGFGFEPASGLECMEMKLLQSGLVENWMVDFIPSGIDAFVAINPDTKSLAWVKNNDTLVGVWQSFDSPLSQVSCIYRLNDEDGQINLITGSPNADAEIPAAMLALKQNYPNPFNPNTSIEFTLGTGKEPVSLKIYNAKGQLVKTLWDGTLEAGTHRVRWNGTDMKGSSVSSGIYLYRLSQGKNIQIRKMVIAQ